MLSRRRFLGAAAAAAAAPGEWLQDLRPRGPCERRGRVPTAPVGWAAAARDLRSRFRDLRRRFVFEYYPWYGRDPWRHWDEAERRPPWDLAATSVPRLGPYDSRDPRVVEQHARWIAESGVGAINVSWWGPGSFEDRAVPLVMDVMRDHDIRVTFHLEPYETGRASRYRDDVLYLVREYGDRRGWDAFLLLEGPGGAVAPVFKSFATILPREATDCHGVTSLLPAWVPDGTWRRQTDGVREALRQDFGDVTLLADVSDVGRLKAAGFDGMAIYDNFVRPETWRSMAQACQREGLLFSFNCNPGFDGIHLRTVPPDSCYQPTPFEPPSGEFDWFRASDRERARLAAQARIAESWKTTVTLQTDRTLPNVERGFFLTFINSFNEWHEGTQFEPMKDAAGLTPEERAFPYRNPADGRYRIETVRTLMGLVTGSEERGARS